EPSHGEHDVEELMLLSLCLISMYREPYYPLCRCPMQPRPEPHAETLGKLRSCTAGPRSPSPDPPRHSCWVESPQHHTEPPSHQLAFPWRPFPPRSSPSPFPSPLQPPPPGPT